jgi:phage portal protein BeeE
MFQRFGAAWETFKRSATDAAGYFFANGMDLNGSPEQLREPYKKSAWVRSAIDKIAGPIAAIAVDFYPAGGAYSGSNQEKRRKGSTYKVYRRGVRSIQRDADEALELPAMCRFLREPMKGLGYSDFVEATIGWLRMAGESFWILPGEATMAFPSEVDPKVIVARPDRMRHVVDGDELLGWEFTDGRGKRISLLPEQVIQLKQWNPYDKWRGLGQFEAAILAAEADWLAGRFARNLMANNGDTGPYIVAKNGIPNDDQRKQIIADLRAKRAAQQRGRFQPIFLTGDITIEDPQIRTVDAAYVAGRIENRHEIYIALGVPPSMADVKAAYSIGSASDFYQLILNTCVPAGDKFCDGLARLAERFERQPVEAFLDWDEHPVLQEVRKERLQSVDVLWAKGMPVNLISDYLGLCLPRFAGDDVGYLPFSVSPVGASEVEPASTPDLAEPDAVAEAAKALRLLKHPAKAAASKRVTHCCGCSLDDSDLELRDRDPKEVAQWKTLVARRLPFIKAYRTAFDKLMMEARRQMLSKMGQHKAVGKAAAADFMFDIVDFKHKFEVAIRAVAMDAVKDAGNQAWKECGKDDPWKVPSHDTLQFLGDRTNKLSDVPDEVFDRIKSAIDDGIKSGDPMDQIADAVRAECNAISDKRGKTIAQTETSACYGFGRHAAMKAAGIQFKKWLTSGNSNVRESHRLMNGTVQELETPFVVVDPKTGDSDSIMHPGDADGAPWNVINCHCVEVASTAGPDSND